MVNPRESTVRIFCVHARRRAAESVLLGQIESGFEVGKNAARVNSLKSLQCEEQDSNLHALRTLEPKSSASANSATLACGVISDG